MPLGIRGDQLWAAAGTPLYQGNMVPRSFNGDPSIESQLWRCFSHDKKITKLYQKLGPSLVSWNLATRREIFSKSYQIKPKSGYIYTFLIDLESNGRPFGSKSIGKW